MIPQAHIYKYFPILYRHDFHTYNRTGRILALKYADQHIANVRGIVIGNV